MLDLLVGLGFLAHSGAVCTAAAADGLARRPETFPPAAGGDGYATPRSEAGRRDEGRKLAPRAVEQPSRTQVHVEQLERGGPIRPHAQEQR